MEVSDEERIMFLFYQYYNIESLEKFCDQFYCFWFKLGVYGCIYIVNEGINGQIFVFVNELEIFKEKMYDVFFLDGICLNIVVDDDGKFFYKLKIKVCKKIVVDGLDDISFDVIKCGKYLDVVFYNELVDQEDIVIVDMCNYYESEVGYFEGVICFDVEIFREVFFFVEDMLEEKKDSNIIMYCIGGICCEKVSVYYLYKGFENVFMVDGGIIEYMC